MSMDQQVIQVNSSFNLGSLHASTNNIKVCIAIIIIICDLICKNSHSQTLRFLYHDVLGAYKAFFCTSIKSVILIDFELEG